MVLILSIWFAKILTLFLRVSKRGGGTTLPGYILEKRFPGLLAKLINQIPRKIIITGTNGKTTTQTLLVNMLKNAGHKVVSNISGANLSRGILTTLLNKAGSSGKLNYDYAIFEIEEGTFPRIAEKLDATTVIVTNLFRDQLDAYGEINKTRDYIIEGIKKSPNARIILNSDDPKAADIANTIENQKVFFGLDKKYIKEFAYEGRQSASVSSKDKLTAKEIKLNPDLSTSFKFEGYNHRMTIEKFMAPGIYNVYNALAAIQAAYIEKIGKSTILDTFKSFEPAFGRGESVEINHNGKKLKIVMMLIKNPAGFSLALKTLKEVKAKDLVILINDNVADGKDVSWLWDSKIEILNNFEPDNVIVSGTRADDMLLRIKYALDSKLSKVSDNKFQADKINVYIRSDIEGALNVSFAAATETIYILPTYTAMLELRKILSKNHNLKKFWE